MWETTLASILFVAIYKKYHIRVKVSLVHGQFWKLEIVGSNPTTLTIHGY